MPAGLDAGRLRAAFLDLDGTIVSESRPVPGAAAAIAALEASGVRCVIATGRMFTSARRLGAELGITAPIVCYQGALVGEPESGEILRHEPLDAITARGIVARVRALGHHVNVFVSEQVFVEEENPEARRYATSAGVPLNAVGDLVEWLAEPVTKLVCSGEPAVMDELKAVLVPEFGDDAFIAKSLPHYLEMAASGVSKATGAEVVCARLGFASAECLAVGDGENDLELLAWAGYGVAVGGGFPALLAAADHVSAPLTEDGVPRLLAAIAAARS